MGDDIFKLVGLIDDQLSMKGEKTEIRKQVVDEEVVIDHKDILLVELPVMPVVETIMIKWTHPAATVL